MVDHADVIVNTWLCHYYEGAGVTNGVKVLLFVFSLDVEKTGGNTSLHNMCFVSSYFWIYKLWKFDKSCWVLLAFPLLADSIKHKLQKRFFKLYSKVPKHVHVKCWIVLIFDLYILLIGQLCDSEGSMANSNQEELGVMGIDEDVAHK